MNLEARLNSEVRRFVAIARTPPADISLSADRGLTPNAAGHLEVVFMEVFLLYLRVITWLPDALDEARRLIAFEATLAANEAVAHDQH